MTIKVYIIKELTDEDKKRYSRICDEIIDILTKKYELTPAECGFVIRVLMDSLSETFGVKIKVEEDSGHGASKNR